MRLTPEQLQGDSVVGPMMQFTMEMEKYRGRGRVGEGEVVVEMFKERDWKCRC